MSEEKRCPVCQGEMWNMSKSKFPQKPGSPDFKCKDKECKWKMDKDTGEWIESEYQTAIWLPKPKSAPRKPFPERSPSAPGAGIAQPEHAKKEMLISYAKDIVVAEIAKGIEVKEPFKRVADGFKVLMMAYAHPFGVPKPEPKPVPEVDIGEEAPSADEGEEIPF